jgi:hypothetical protein
MAKYKSTRFYAVIETGRCSDDSRCWEERESCGHAHKTRDAAVKCLTKKALAYCEHGIKAGDPCDDCLNGYAYVLDTNEWYRGEIHNQNGERA